LDVYDFGSFHSRFDNVINDSFNYTQMKLSGSIEFSVALLRLAAHLFMFLFIFNEQRVAEKTAEVDEPKTKYLQQSCQIKQRYISLASCVY
jgi:hypothetical protein